mmetsp:Transcript_16997/g.42126  ORF Transcript_16997/g.42126 Transcript_16997/m.42126 type:complete len:204 (+) Transcript_16997:794-1405(+)
MLRLYYPPVTHPWTSLRAGCCAHSLGTNPSMRRCQVLPSFRSCFRLPPGFQTSSCRTVRPGFPRRHRCGPFQSHRQSRPRAPAPPRSTRLGPRNRRRCRPAAESRRSPRAPTPPGGAPPSTASATSKAPAANLPSPSASSSAPPRPNRLCCSHQLFPRRRRQAAARGQRRPPPPSSTRFSLSSFLLPPSPSCPSSSGPHPSSS